MRTIRIKEIDEGCYIVMRVREVWKRVDFWAFVLLNVGVVYAVIRALCQR